MPPAGNANFAWVQHFLYHLSPTGAAGLVLSNGSLSSNTSGEGEIRKRLVTEDLVDCVVMLPTQLFYNTGIPACLWFLSRYKNGNKNRDRKGEVLFIDASELGYMLTRSSRAFTEEEIDRVAGTYHEWKRSGGISDLPNFIDEFVFISEEKARDLKSSRVYENDLVFPHRGNIGEAGIVVESKYKEYIISSSLMKLSCNTNLVYPKFLYYFFKSHQGRKKLLENSSQVGTPGIATPLASLKNIDVSLPSLPEQKRIASILSCLDRKIENLRKQNETLEEIARSIFKHWFIEFEFPNADGKPYKSSGGVMVRSELGDIPEGWHVGKLGDIASFHNGKSPPERSEEFNIPIYGSNGIIGKANIANYHNIIIIGRVGSYCGSLYYFLDRCWVTDNAMIGKIRNADNHAFLYFILQKIGLNRLSTGSGQPLLNQTILSSIEWVLPQNIHIEKFEITVKPFFQKMLLNNNQIQTLTKSRDALLPKLMSGQLRVEI